MFGGHSFNENPPYFAYLDFSILSEFHFKNIDFLAKKLVFLMILFFWVYNSEVLGFSNQEN